eukprot:3782089-Rhodomonas_salina.2
MTPHVAIATLPARVLSRAGSPRFQTEETTPCRTFPHPQHLSKHKSPRAAHRIHRLFRDEKSYSASEQLPLKIVTFAATLKGHYESLWNVLASGCS